MSLNDNFVPDLIITYGATSAKSSEATAAAARATGFRRQAMAADSEKEYTALMAAAEKEAVNACLAALLALEQAEKAYAACAGLRDRLSPAQLQSATPVAAAA